MKQYLSLIALLSISSLSYGNPRAQLLQSAIQRGVRLKAGNLKGLPSDFSRMMSSETNQTPCQGCGVRKKWLDKKLTELKQKDPFSPAHAVIAGAVVAPVGATLASVILISGISGVSEVPAFLSFIGPESSFGFPAFYAAVGAGGAGLGVALNNAAIDDEITSLKDELSLYSEVKSDLEKLD